MYVTFKADDFVGLIDRTVTAGARGRYESDDVVPFTSEMLTDVRDADVQ